MPLHLLGKKSWNVYNTDNIARVRKDEAAAQAKEEEQERRWREDDADRRLQLLRGQEPTPVIEDDAPVVSAPPRDRDGPRKKRRLAGEDDTDHEIRLAREDLCVPDENSGQDLARWNPIPCKGQRDTPDRSNAQPEPSIQGMRFKDAAGFKQRGEAPWNTGADTGIAHEGELVGRDVWGNEDPRRHEREQQRISTNDPLLAMKRGVKKLRENEKERRNWIQQRERDMHEIEQLARQERRKKRHHRENDEDEFGDFRLDDARKPQQHKSESEAGSHSKHRGSHHHHRHRHRSRSPQYERRRRTATRDHIMLPEDTLVAEELHLTLRCILEQDEADVDEADKKIFTKVKDACIAQINEEMLRVFGIKPLRTLTNEIKTLFAGSKAPLRRTASSPFMSHLSTKTSHSLTAAFVHSLESSIRSSKSLEVKADDKLPEVQTIAVSSVRPARLPIKELYNRPPLITEYQHIIASTLKHSYDVTSSTSMILEKRSRNRYSIKDLA